ncbi:hypothetical protein AB0L99_44510 [Streptomyces sp. NPDC051954]|uniref:hypothetical protein n=1 Tax=unclassified Streptomyces TaxID=2593676 RepID=UPI00341F6897
MNRIKKIKRQLYGRAEFELLRKMILLPRPTVTAPSDRCQSPNGVVVAKQESVDGARLGHALADHMEAGLHR